MEESIFVNRLLGLLLKTKSYRAGLLVHMLYSHEISKLSRVSVCDCVSDFRAISKHEAVFVISLKEKQLECIWRITCLEEDVLDVFPMGFDKRHDSESDKIVSPHWFSRKQLFPPKIRLLTNSYYSFVAFYSGLLFCAHNFHQNSVTLSWIISFCLCRLC